MSSFTMKMFFKKSKNNFFYFLFLSFLFAAITLFSDLIVLQSSYIKNTTATALVNDMSGSLSYVGNVLTYDVFSLVIILVIIFLGFYGFQFYLNNQTPILAVFRVSGVSFFKILFFMLVQLLIIYAAAVGIGFGIGTLFYQFMNGLIMQMMGIPQQAVVISSEAIIYIISIVGIKLAYLLMIAVGFIYRHEIKDLLRHQETFDPQKAIKQKKPSSKFQIVAMAISLFIYIGIIIFGSGKPHAVFNANCFIAIGGFSLLLENGIKLINDTLKVKTKDTNIYIGLCHLQFFIQKIIKYLIFFSILLVVISQLLVVSFPVLVDFVYNSYVYFIISIIFLFSIIYQFVLNANTRTKDFAQLIRLGKTKNDLNKILNVEIQGFFLVLFITIFIFPLLLFCSALIYGDLSIFMAFILIGSTFFIFIIAYLIAKTLLNKMIPILH